MSSKSTLRHAMGQNAVLPLNTALCPLLSALPPQDVILSDPERSEGESKDLR
jgi:hypothetical protein